GRQRRRILTEQPRRHVARVLILELEDERRLRPDVPRAARDDGELLHLAPARAPPRLLQRALGVAPRLAPGALQQLLGVDAPVPDLEVRQLERRAHRLAIVAQTDAHRLLDA